MRQTAVRSSTGLSTMQPTRGETRVGSFRMSSAANGRGVPCEPDVQCPVRPVPPADLEHARRSPHLLVVRARVEAGEVRAAGVPPVQELVEVGVGIDVGGLPEGERDVPLLAGIGRAWRSTRRKRCGAGTLGPPHRARSLQAVARRCARPPSAAGCCSCRARPCRRAGCRGRALALSPDQHARGGRCSRL